MSLRTKLLKWLVVPLLVVNFAGAGVIYWLAWKPAQAALDQGLADAAWALVPHVVEAGSTVELKLSQQAEQVLRVDHFDEVFFVVRDIDGRTIAGDLDFPILQDPEKRNVSLAYSDLMRGEQVRVISLKTIIADSTVMIGVAETRVKRQELHSRILLSLLALEILLALVIPLVIWLALARGLQPLRQMQENLAARKVDDGSPLPIQNAPVEIVPFIRAINDLLQRVQQSARTKQDFLANVAHQLRTPLAGFKAQLEWLQGRHRNDADTARSASMMMDSTERMARKANQLLALARSEPGDFERRRLERLSLDQLVAGSVQNFVNLASKKNIDLGFDLQPTMVNGDPFLLRDLVDNLVDNAIRYSQPGSAVTVSCKIRPDCAVLEVEDAGSGIPESEKERIFSRFYRLDHGQPGSGLGLSIVRDIAMDHDALIQVNPGPDGSGTVFSVLFPLISQSA